MRSAESQELLHDLLAFGLLAVIAFRARWRLAFSAEGLEIGEARVGDYENCGMTRREYRTRIARLVKWGFITVRPTRKGTIARLISTAVFDINLASNERLTSQANPSDRPSNRPTNLPAENHAERPSEQPADGQHAATRRPVTNKVTTKQRKNAAVERADLAELSAIAATPGSDLDFVEALKPRFPNNDVQREYERFRKYCRDKGRTPTRQGFISHWMVHARPELRPLPPASSSQKKTSADYERRLRESRERADREAGLT